MLALRLARGAHPGVQVRRLLVAAASAGTGFLLLCTLAYAMQYPGTGSVLRLAWCVAPIAATVYFAVAVARTDPGTRPRPGLSAVGLGPGRLMVLAGISTAVACTLGSLLALLFFLHLRGDLSGLPFDGAAAGLLAGDRPLPLAAALTLLTVVPLAASAASATALRPRPGKAGARPRGDEGAEGKPPRHRRRAVCRGASRCSLPASPWRRTRAARGAWRAPASGCRAGPVAPPWASSPDGP